MAGRVRGGAGGGDGKRAGDDEGAVFEKKPQPEAAARMPVRVGRCGVEGGTCGSEELSARTV